MRNHSTPCAVDSFFIARESDSLNIGKWEHREQIDEPDFTLNITNELNK